MQPIGRRLVVPESNILELLVLILSLPPSFYRPTLTEQPSQSPSPFVSVAVSRRRRRHRRRRRRRRHRSSFSSVIVVVIVATSAIYWRRDGRKRQRTC